MNTTTAEALAEGTPPMQSRSWYLRSDVADQLAETVTQLHYSARVPKHEVLGAVVAVALDHPDEIRARLAASGEGPGAGGES